MYNVTTSILRTSWLRIFCIFLPIVASNITACSSTDDQSSYKKTEAPATIIQVAPNYFSDDNMDFSSQKKAPQSQYPNQQTGGYYGQVRSYPQQRYQQPQKYQQPYYPQQGYYAPQPYQPQQNYQPQVVPGSRFYTNPYDIPPSTQPQQYDADQYYAPPTSYRGGNMEPSTTFGEGM